MVGARQGSHRKVSWDLLRTGCVALVMLYHSTSLSVFLHPELQPRTFRFPFQVGASLLLVVSAYFACVTIGRGTVLRYWWGRVARLLPSFLAGAVIIFLLLRAYPIDGWFWPSTRDLLAHLLMLWHWKPDDFRFIDGSHWTVPLQLMGFTAAALLYRSRWGHGRRMLVVLWAALLIPILQWPVRVQGPPEIYRLLVDGFGFHRWHLFVAGVAIWLWSTRRLRGLHFAGLLATSMLAHTVHNFTRGPEGELLSDWGSSIAVCIGLSVITLVARGPDWASRLPATTAWAVRWFAGISYGVFLMHQAVGYVVVRQLHDLGAPTSVQTLGMITAGVLLGWMLTRAVERPAHLYLMHAYDRFFDQATTARA